MGRVTQRVKDGSGPGGQVLSGLPGHLLGRGFRAELPRTGGGFVRAGHREDVAGAALLQCGPQLRVAAMDLVTRDPYGPVAGVQEPGDHVSGQLAPA